jgi:hypothetical protein
MTIGNLRRLAIAALLSVIGTTVFAQDLPQAFVDRSAPTALDYSEQFLEKRPGLLGVGGKDYVPPAACFCTNLGGVSIICPDCDNEMRVEFCHTHDRACQDAAQKGGIREHNTFYCTTKSN